MWITGKLCGITGFYWLTKRLTGYGVIRMELLDCLANKRGLAGCWVIRMELPDWLANKRG